MLKAIPEEVVPQQAASVALNAAGLNYEKKHPFLETKFLWFIEPSMNFELQRLQRRCREQIELWWAGRHQLLNLDVPNAISRGLQIDGKERANNLESDMVCLSAHLASHVQGSTTAQLTLCYLKTGCKPSSASRP